MILLKLPMSNLVRVARPLYELGSELSALPEEERPDKVVVCIVTDGYENASKEFTQAIIKEMIEHQTSKYNWKVTYIGANQNAVHTADGIGIVAGAALSFTANAACTQNTFRSVGAYVSRVRNASINDVVAYTQQERTDSLDDEGK